MVQLRTIYVCAALALSACDSAAEPVDEAKPGVVKPDEAKPVAEVAAPEENALEKDDRDPITGDQLARARQRLEVSRELAELYKTGKLGDRLATGEFLVVDAKAPTNTHQAQFFVYAGKIAAPAKFADLKPTKGSDGKPAKSILQGGEDGPRVAVFRDIVPGPYTVCAVISGPTDAANQAKLKQAADVMDDGKLSPEKLKAAGEAAKADGYVPQKTDWDALPVRCKTVEVGDAASRVVVLE